MNRDSISEQAYAKKEYRKRIEAALLPILREYTELTGRHVEYAGVEFEHVTGEDGTPFAVGYTATLRTLPRDNP